MELDMTPENQVRRTSSRKFVALIFRLSIVAGIGFGLFDAYKTIGDYNVEQTDYVRNKMRMECAAKVSDDWLTRNTNEFGNVDVSSICGPGADGKTFFVNASEINSTRKGEDTYAILLSRKPYDIEKSLIMVTAVFIGTNLIGSIILGLFLVGRWIVFGVSRQH